tara:strand:+ start:69771 stop:71117 length:1347 start_codon:yes stop_codon:yes gene_type:complete
MEALAAEVDASIIPPPKHDGMLGFGFDSYYDRALMDYGVSGDASFGRDDSARLAHEDDDNSGAECYRFAVPPKKDTPPPKVHVYKETCIFKRGDSTPVSQDKQCELEARKILKQGFVSCIDPLALKEDENSSKLADIIFRKSNYDVLEITAIKNSTLETMFAAFKDCYNIDADPITVYHGTSSENVKYITEGGFRGVMASRSKYGKGIYVSTNVWEAGAYAAPDAEHFIQTVLVVSFHKGATVLGTPDMVHFGMDLYGDQVLTSMNQAGNIFCASRENQLLSTHRIKMRFKKEQKMTYAQNRLVQIFHPTIFDVAMKAWQITPVKSGPTSHHTHGSGQRESHHGFGLKDQVTITKQYQVFGFCNGQSGTIEKIFKREDAQGHFVFLVKMHNSSFDDIIARENAKRKEMRSPLYSNFNPTWLICKRNQLVHLDSAGSNSKRQKLDRGRE